MEVNNTQQPYQNTNVMSVKDWILTLLVLAIPCVNIIMLFVWAFGSDADNLNRKNYCKASLIIFAVVLALYLFFFLIFGVLMASSIRSFQ